MGMRPLPPDSLPVIGPMQMHPNVVLNECYGAQGGMSLFCSQLAAAIVDGKDLNELADPQMQKALLANRMLI